VTQAQVWRVGCSVASSVATCGYKYLASTVIKMAECGEFGRGLASQIIKKGPVKGLRARG
jgi:hypothetical protein